MSKNVTFDFVINKKNNTIKISREFAANISLVWEAHTNSEILDKWWAPKPWKARTKYMNFTEGGSWLYAMIGPNGEEHWSLAEYTQVEFEKKYTGIDGFTDTEGKINIDMPQSKWVVNFTDKGDITLVEFMINYPDLIQLERTIQMGFKEGLSVAMEGLDELLASNKK